MATNFPASLDALTNPSSNSSVANPSHAQQHADANDAIEALEAKVGITGSAVTTSHDYKIAQLESLVTSSVAGAKSIYQDVRNQSGSSLSKATPVYVSGSEGASGKILISAASNAAESTSSKTMGITTSAIANNSNGQVISEGILEGIDTTGAVDGDPVWLGIDGAKIYGLANKPSAPAHLVFLGVVIRGGQANTGSMYVKIQNGFELQELHNVQISSLLNGNILAYDSTSETWKNTNTLQSTSSTTPLVIKGSTSQSVNIVEVQLAGSTQPYFSVTSGGNGIFYTALSVNQSNSSSVGANYGIGAFEVKGTSFMRPINAAGIVLITRGAASQTANLQEWQNSSGTVLAKINQVGSGIFGNATLNAIGNLNAFSSATTVVPLVVQGATSQTANLQEWQNSSGTIIAKVNASGSLTSTGDMTIANGAVSLTVNQVVYASGYSLMQFGSSAKIKNYFIASPTLVVQGPTSQTANLQEWQNSSGTVLAKVDASGSMFTTTAAAGINTTQVATTEFVQTEIISKSDKITTINAQSTSYTLATSDSDKLVEMSGGGTLTITDSSSFPVGFTCNILQTGSSQVTIAGNGFTPNATPGLKLRAQWSSATLVKRALNSWVVMGDLSA